jgi:hypothetical protein
MRGRNTACPGHCGRLSAHPLKDLHYVTAALVLVAMRRHPVGRDSRTGRGTHPSHYRQRSHVWQWFLLISAGYKYVVPLHNMSTLPYTSLYSLHSEKRHFNSLMDKQCELVFTTRTRFLGKLNKENRTTETCASMLSLNLLFPPVSILNHCLKWNVLLQHRRSLLLC